MEAFHTLLQLSTLIILICGGALFIHYFKTGEILLEQLVGGSIGIVLLLSLLVWRMKKKSIYPRNNYEKQ